MIRTFALLAVLGGVAHAAPKKKPPPAEPPKEAPAPPPAPPPPPIKPLPKPGDRRRVIAILDVRVGDGVPADVAQQFQKDLDQMVDPEHYFLAPRYAVHELMTNSTRWVDGCLLGPCIREVRTQTQADVALIAALTGSGTSFGSVITLVRTDSGHVIGQATGRCDVCTLNEALATAEKASVKLLEGLPPKLPDEDAPQKAAVTAATAPLEAKITTLEHANHHAGMGIGLVITGLVIAGAGFAIYEAASHNEGGLMAAGGGVGLAAAGICVLTF